MKLLHHSLHWPKAQPKANNPDQGPITRKQYRNHYVMISLCIDTDKRKVV